MTIDKIDINNIVADSGKDVQLSLRAILNKKKIEYETYALRYVEAENEDAEIEVFETDMYLLQDSHNLYWLIWIIGKSCFLKCLYENDSLMRKIARTSYELYNSFFDDYDVEDDFTLENGEDVEQLSEAEIFCFYTKNNNVLQSIQLLIEHNYENYTKYGNISEDTLCYFNVNIETKLSDVVRIVEDVYEKYFPSIPEAAENDRKKDLPSLEKVFSTPSLFPKRTVFVGEEEPVFKVTKKGGYDPIRTSIIYIRVKNIRYALIKYGNGYEVFAEPCFSNFSFLDLIQYSLFPGYDNLNDCRETAFYIGAIKGKTDPEIYKSFFELMDDEKRQHDTDVLNPRAIEYVLKTMLKR